MLILFSFISTPNSIFIYYREARVKKKVGELQYCKWCVEYRRNLGVSNTPVFTQHVLSECLVLGLFIFIAKSHGDVPSQQHSTNDHLWP